ncbi:HDIG domain-containing protein [Gaiella occulta]|uniref:HDIG domain-containing protein n=1 Tax=Gaiella occulta TaxID=1002870 RepID=A0A7M2YWA7_9ACTN|nr:HD-GYP domain-containing protein [Gaiella occulta]RDI74413.1 HDIG domain-containing protein [Gaiella occulta]
MASSQPPTPADLRLSEVVSALSYALDVAEGQAIGHAVRSCVIGMRLADEIGLAVEARSALFYGLLLKDAGCSSNAAKVSALFAADDHEAKRNVKLVDHSRVPAAMRYVWDNVGGRGPRRVANAVGALARGPRAAKEMTQIRCERGAAIAEMLDLPSETADAIRCLDEHWDGRGHPAGLAGEAIPQLARILNLAQVVEVFHSANGRDAAYEVAHGRAGRWFDPELVRAAERFRDDDAFWDMLGDGDVRLLVAGLEPQSLVLAADDTRLDRVAEAFALVIDAKSPFTFRHSERVAELAGGAGRELGLDADELRDLRRAALLHDIGKLAISNRILDKPGRLDDDERAAIERHPAFTAEILGRIPHLDGLAAVAAAHHEKLDGSGYHLGLRGDEIPPAARVLVVADIFEALTAERPYRVAMTTAAALGLMQADVGTKLGRDAFAALEASLRTARAPLRAA